MPYVTDRRRGRKRPPSPLPKEPAKKQNKGKISSSPSPVVKFDVNERVLCYEPDPSKAKVLYDSKVLKVVHKKDTKGKKTVEYLIHFQGWKSSWDRNVSEEFVLKDTPENRKLQANLKEQVKGQIGKKRRGPPPVAEIIRAHLENNKEKVAINKQQKPVIVVEPNKEPIPNNPPNPSTDVEKESSDEEKETVPLCIPDEIKLKLDSDFEKINKEKKLVSLPANPCVIKILEDYVKHYTYVELIAWNEARKELLASVPAPVHPPIIRKPGGVKVTPKSSTLPKKQVTIVLPPIVSSAPRVKKTPQEEILHELKKVFRRVQILKEVVEGIRVIFDFLLHQQLLYNKELEQHGRIKFIKPQKHTDDPCIPLGNYDFMIVEEIEDVKPFIFAVPLPPPPRPPSPLSDEFEPLKKRRLTRSMVLSNPNLLNPPICSPAASIQLDIKPFIEPLTSLPIITDVIEKPKVGPSANVRVKKFLERIQTWKLLPHSLYRKAPAYPSQIYGSIHLARLFVMLPEVLSKSTIPRKKLKRVVEHINEILQFITKHNLIERNTYRNNVQKI